MPRLNLVLTEKEQLATDLFRLRFNCPDGLIFLPGQYMSMAVGSLVRRSYSIANTPQENTYFETFADTIPAGPGSQFIKDVEIGTSVEFIGPLGNFVYKPGSNPVIFCATGTGIVPFLSMIKHELFELKSGREIHLYLGARDVVGLVQHELLQHFEKEFSNFHYFPHLSSPDTGWSGATGWITPTINTLANLANYEAYICGGPQMILDVENTLLDKTIPKTAIYYEKYY